MFIFFTCQQSLFLIYSNFEIHDCSNLYFYKTFTYRVRSIESSTSILILAWFFDIQLSKKIIILPINRLPKVNPHIGTHKKRAPGNAVDSFVLNLLSSRWVSYICCPRFQEWLQLQTDDPNSR